MKCLAGNLFSFRNLFDMPSNIPTAISRSYQRISKCSNLKKVNYLKSNKTTHKILLEIKRPFIKDTSYMNTPRHYKYAKTPVRNLINTNCDI